eukprot:scaffold5294_cov72-Cyclotella_meneghiniana.AAC.15
MRGGTSQRAGTLLIVDLCSVHWVGNCPYYCLLLRMPWMHTLPLCCLHNQLGNNNSNNNTTSSVAAASSRKGDIFDDESTYSAMATVAGNCTVVSKHSLAITKSKRSRTAKVLAEKEAAQQEAALLANELRDPGPSIMLCTFKRCVSKRFW